MGEFFGALGVVLFAVFFGLAVKNLLDRAHGCEGRWLTFGTVFGGFFIVLGIVHAVYGLVVR